MITVEIFKQAILFSVKAHRGQRRKGDGRPYILHPMDVLNILYSVKESKNMYLLGAVSMLHDTVEDCGVSLKKITRKFGLQVASLVEELTLDKEKYKTIGKTAYLCQEVIKMSNYALCIKLCDRLSNVCDVKGMTKEFIQMYKHETRQIINTLITKRVLTKTQWALVELIKAEL